MPDHRNDLDRPRHAGSRAASSTAAASGAGGLKVSPFCSALRSKKLLGATVPALTDEDVLDRSMWCWCGQTEQLLGPDRKPAHPEDCRKGRACFASPFEPLL